MAKSATRLTQRALEDLRTTVLPDARALSTLRTQMQQLQVAVDQGRALSEMSDQQIAEQFPSHWVRMQAINNRDSIAENEVQMDDLRPQIRRMADELDERSQPAWAHVASYAGVDGMDEWVSFMEVRPKVLRAEGLPLLFRLAGIVNEPVRVPLGKWLIRHLQDLRKRSLLYGIHGWFDEPMKGVNASGFAAISKWAHAHDNQVKKALEDHEGLEQLASAAREWATTTRVRAHLGGAGVSVGEIAAGELRLMAPEDLGPLGKYMHFCIGAARYVERARQKTWAFVSLYDSESKLPVATVEITPESGKDGLVMGQAQGRMNRTTEHREALAAWVARPQTKFTLMRALGIPTGSELIHRVPAECASAPAWKASSPAQTWNRPEVRYDITDAVKGVLMGQVSLDRATMLAKRHAGPGVADALAEKVSSALDVLRETSQTGEVHAHFAAQAEKARLQKWAEELAEEQRLVCEQLRELKELGQLNPPCVDEREAVRITRAALGDATLIV